MRHDFERSVSETLVAYLNATVDSTTRDVCPVVSFFDPMDVDDADRIIVSCEGGATKISGPGNAIVQVTVTVNTKLAQPTMSANIVTHFERVNEVRDVLTVADLADILEAYNVAGIYLTSVNSERQFTTSIDRDSMFASSDYQLTIHCNTLTE